MMGDGYGNSSGGGKRKKKKKSRGRKRTSSEQLVAWRAVQGWAFPETQAAAAAAPAAVDGFLPSPPRAPKEERVVFELHSHTRCSDGFLTPTAVVERAHRRGVKVLALTDHDTMAGIPEAVETARKFGIRIIPGVEISAVFSPREGSGTEEPVHILAYYSGCGPSRYEELESCLSSIRDGRYLRAKNMLLKLNKLKVPLKWEQVAKIAGNGVAPGRVHVARAMVEAGHVENLRQAFNRYLYDGGPAYATGSEPLAEEAVQLICRTGGISALAHPWALKNPVAVIRSLKAAGLHAVEVYRSDGKVAEFSELCDNYGLMKIGGSDYHGRGGKDESDLGSVDLPAVAVHEFVKVGCPIWYGAIKDILKSFTENPTETTLGRLIRFGKGKYNKEASLNCVHDNITPWLSKWLTNEETQTSEFEELLLKLKDIDVSNKLYQLPVLSNSS